ncbi:hypothetical protein BDZ97DRAFT_1607500, partial [Flammula alnicola]
INHCKILDGSGWQKIRSISLAVHKMDKFPWSEVKKEMTQEKGLDGAIADKIGEYV